MTGAFAAAVAVEARKLVASRVVQSATVLLVGGIALLAGSMTAAAEAGNEQVLGQLGPLADEEGWPRLVGIAAQIIAAGGLLGFGIVLAWTVGREFAEGTISGLFALPVSRAQVAGAKLAVFVAWAVTVAIGLTAVIAIVGLVIGMGSVDDEAARGLYRLLALGVFSALLAIPAAWTATLGRGLLPGIAATIGTIVIAQVMVVAGTGGWFPFTAPALWGIDPGAVSVPQLALVPIVPLLFSFLTMRLWSKLELDR